MIKITAVIDKEAINFSGFGIPLDAGHDNGVVCIFVKPRSQPFIPQDVSIYFRNNALARFNPGSQVIQ